MKTKLITLLALSWTMLAPAQTFTAGTNALAQNNWWGANTNFAGAVASSPSNPDANVLWAATRLLTLPQTPAGSNFLVALGFPKTNRYLNFQTPAAGLQQDANGYPIFPANYNSASMVAFFRTNIMTAIAASATNLAVVTDPNYTLALSSAETGVESVTLDYGDIQMLRAALSVAQFTGYTLNANNFSVVMPQIVSLMENNGFTFQAILADYPSLLTINSAADLASSKGALTNAIANYFAASSFIRNRPANATNRLFTLDAGEVAQESEFRTILTNALLSLNAPTEFDTDKISSTLYAGAYFAGTHSVRSLMPQFNGMVYVNGSLPDYTFGGILPYQPAYKTEEMLRQEFYNYAGIYAGTVSDTTFGDPDAGDFAVFVSTNGQATVVGYDNDTVNDDAYAQSGGIFAQFSVDKNGNWNFNSNSVTGVSGYGSIDKSGNFNGELYFTNGDSVLLYNYQPSLQPPLGPFQNAAGYYSGPASGTSTSGGGNVSGTLMAVLAADGQLTFREVDSSGQYSDGGQGQLNANNNFTTVSAGYTTVSGTLTNATHKIGGTFVSSDSSGTYTLTRQANVPFDVPPVITTNLPASKIVALGTNATFFLTATGSPPMCFQWFLNGNAIPGAISNTLIVSNNLWTSTGTYSISASAINVGGGTNSQTCVVNVTAETTPPTIAITSPLSGQLWSNATFTVTGTAGDSVAVTNVFYSLNNSPFAPVLSANNWANWSTNLTLVPGTNTISAYSVNVGGIPSATSNATVVYVQTAALTVQTNGLGSISPDYNGSLLQIGATYSMTATAGTGFAFTNWTGSITTNGATLVFTMASNLTFTANFVDVQKPVVAITNITTGMLVSNAVFTVMGWATDNVAVARVYCSLSNAVVNAAFSSVATANNWANWSTNLTLAAGTNTIAAYAVDNSGNISPTNSAKLVYVSSTTLTVRTNGLGSISPNDNGALLQIGTTYSLTATAGTGFMFTNWTGGTSLPLAFVTNGATVAFAMQSNLVLQANFVETSKPTLNVTNLTAGQRISNAVFTVKGTTSDNWGVSNVVYQVNGGVWNSATNINSWTNWAAGVTLVPGTNVFQAYAVNLGGDSSTTNSLSFQYVVTNQLQVRMAGLGTLSPNYSNALLNVGQNYSMSASPGTGFVFTNWTISTNWIGGIITNNATVQFMMTSNLTLQANFVDTSKPTLSITNLVSGQRISNAVFTVKGTASDNWQVGNVAYNLNSGAWSNALPVNSWSNWSATVNLVPGTNTIAAYAADTTGNFSTTNAVSFQYVVTNLLGVQATGLGTISPNYSNAWLNIGQNYSMTATPGSGFVVTNWTISTNWLGGRITNNATVQFMMASNLTLQVNFADVTKPTLTITAPPAGQHMTNALATFAGTASDNWKVAGVWYQLTNAILPGGTWSLATTTNGYTNWTTTVTLAVGTNTIKAYAVDLGGNYSATNNLSVLSSNTFKLQLALTNTLPLKTNGLVFSLQLSTGLNGHIQVSSNLTTWDTLTNFVGTNATLNFLDPAATNSNHRFYRAVIP